MEIVEADKKTESNPNNCIRKKKEAPVLTKIDDKNKFQPPEIYQNKKIESNKKKVIESKSLDLSFFTHTDEDNHIYTCSESYDKNNKKTSPFASMNTVIFDLNEMEITYPGSVVLEDEVKNKPIKLRLDGKTKIDNYEQLERKLQNLSSFLCSESIENKKETTDMKFIEHEIIDDNSTLLDNDLKINEIASITQELPPQKNTHIDLNDEIYMKEICIQNSEIENLASILPKVDKNLFSDVDQQPSILLAPSISFLDNEIYKLENCLGSIESEDLMIEPHEANNENSVENNLKVNELPYKLPEENSYEKDNSIVQKELKLRSVYNLINKTDMVKCVTNIGNISRRDSFILEVNQSCLKKSINTDSRIPTIKDKTHSAKSSPNISPITESVNRRPSLVKKFMEEEALHIEYLHILHDMTIACSLNQQTSVNVMNQADLKKIFYGVIELYEFYKNHYPVLEKKCQRGEYFCGEYFEKMTDYLIFFRDRVESEDQIPEILKKYDNNELFKSTIGRPTKIKELNQYISFQDILKKPTSRLIQYAYFLKDLSDNVSEDLNENKQIVYSVKMFQIFMENINASKSKKSKSSLNRKVIVSYNAVHITDDLKTIRFLFFLNDILVCASQNKKGIINIDWVSQYSQISVIDSNINQDHSTSAKKAEIYKANGNIINLKGEIYFVNTMKNSLKKSQKMLKLTKALYEEELNYLTLTCQFPITFTISDSNKHVFLFSSQEDSDDFAENLHYRGNCKFMHYLPYTVSELLSVVNEKIKETKKNMMEESVVSPTESDDKLDGFLMVKVVSTYRPSTCQDITINLFVDHSKEFYLKKKSKIIKSTDPIDFTQIINFKETENFKVNFESKSDTHKVKLSQKFDLNLLKASNFNRFFFNTSAGHIVCFFVFSTSGEESKFVIPTFYGSSITEIARMEQKVIPSTIVICCTHVMNQGTDVQGIYRKSPIQSELIRMKDVCQKGYLIDTAQLEVAEISLSAALLKIYIREMSTPLATKEICQRLEEWNSNEPENRDSVKEILASSLSLEEYNTLFYLCYHIKQLSKFSSVTLMNDNNLLLLFNQNVFLHHNSTYFTSIFKLFVQDETFFWDSSKITN